MLNKHDKMSKSVHSYSNLLSYYKQAKHENTKFIKNLTLVQITKKFIYAYEAFRNQDKT